jgi:glycosyltransferase involved in cell wall biosynthesis
MRILHVIATLSPSTGGPGEACLGLCRELAKRGHEVSIYTTSYGQSGTLCATDLEYSVDVPAYDSGVEIRCFAETSRRYYLSSLSLFRALRVTIPSMDIVHIHSIYLFHSTVGAYLCRRARVPYVIKPHGTLDPYLRRRHRVRKWLHETIVERRSFRSAAAIQFTTAEEMMLATESRSCGRLFKNAVGAIVPNGVVIPEALETGAPGADIAGLVHKFPELRGKRIVLFLGRINFKKGLDLLAVAFAQLCKQRDDIHLLIAGPDNEGYQIRMTEWLRAANVLDRVTFAGMLRGPYKTAAFKIADMFVLPSYGENFGIAIAEAMAESLPVIVSNRVNIWREIAEAEAGLVIRCDAAELVTAISTLLDDSGLRQSMGDRGRRLVERSFTWQVVGGEMIKLYERILKEHWGASPTVAGLVLRQPSANPDPVEGE